jgi:hypothetical protein
MPNSPGQALEHRVLQHAGQVGHLGFARGVDAAHHGALHVLAARQQGLRR